MKVCTQCGRTFKPRHKRQARCDEHERAHERKRSRVKYRRLKEADRYGRSWRTARKAALERDGHRCRHCGVDRDLIVHHVRPISRGGTNDLANLLTLCRSCHQGAEPR